MRAILKEGLLPENYTDSQSFLSDIDDSDQEVEKQQDIEMKEENAEERPINSK